MVWDPYKMTVYLSGYWSIQPYHSFRNAIKNRGRKGIFGTMCAYVVWKVKYWLWLQSVYSSVGYSVDGDICSPPGRLTYGSSESEITIWSKLSDEPWKQTDTNAINKEQK